MQIKENIHQDGLLLPGTAPEGVGPTISSLQADNAQQKDQLEAKAELEKLQATTPKEQEEDTDYITQQPQAKNSLKSKVKGTLETVATAIDHQEDSPVKTIEVQPNSKPRQVTIPATDKDVVITIKNAEDNASSPIEEKNTTGFPATFKTLMIICTLAAIFLLSVFIFTLFSNRVI